jgi:hypothetical protein
MQRFTDWCRAHLIGYVSWPPIGASFLFVVALWVTGIALGVLLLSFIPSLQLFPSITCILKAATIIGLVLLWWVAWKIADIWERASLDGVVIIWLMISFAVFQLVSGMLEDLAENVRHELVLISLSCIFALLPVLLLLRSHFLRKWERRQDSRDRKPNEPATGGTGGADPSP